MFQWAQSTFDKVAQTVAPTPTDGAGRFVYAVQRNDEDGAMGCIAEIDPVHTVVNQAKGQYPIHIACQYASLRLVRLLLNQPNLPIEQSDLAGNTPLHHASMSRSPTTALECVKLLIQEYGASVLSKNAQGQTPYDVATMNSIRQFLLPIQLQAETRIALENGGQGLPPGIDLGGLNIVNPNVGPPPTSFGTAVAPLPAMQQMLQYGAPPPAATMPYGAPSSMQQPAMMQSYGAQPVPVPVPVPAMPVTPHHHHPDPPGASMFNTPTPTPKNNIASAPASMPVPVVAAPVSGGQHEYSRSGHSSAALSGASKYKADGFHSSSSDVGLQKKYGHSSVQRYIAPPPSSGNSHHSVSANAPNSGNNNPFAAGATAYGSANRYGMGVTTTKGRYPAYGPTASAPAPSTGPVYTQQAYNHHHANAAPSNVTMFTPGGYAAAQPFSPQPQQQQQQQQPSTPYSAQQLQQAPYGTQGTPQQQQQPYATTPSTPYMPPPPYQSHNYQPPAAAMSSQQAAAYQHPVAYQQPAPMTPQQPTAYQRPDFVSPAEATYGSPGTPGGMSVASPSSANGTYPSQIAASDAANAFAVPSPQKDDAASDIFSAPPLQATQEQQQQQPLASTSTPSNPSDVFAAPPSQPTQEQQQPTAVTAPVAVSDVFEAAPSEPTQEQQQPPAAWHNSANNSFGAPSPDQQTQQPQPTTIASNAFAAPAPQGQAAAAAASTLLFAAPQTTTSSEQPTVVASANVFGAAAPSQKPFPLQTSAPAAQQLFVPQAGVSPLKTMPLNSISRAMSAEELFSEDAPFEEPQQQQPTSSSEPAVAPVQQYQPADDASALFAAAGPAGSGSAEQVFGSSGTAQTEAQQPVPTSSSSSGQNASEAKKEEQAIMGGDDSDGDEGDMDDVPMDDIPLSPTLQRPVATETQQSTAEQQQQPAAAAAPADNNLFAAIGMPPPPFSKKR
jgi:hypothetical protein